MDRINQILQHPCYQEYYTKIQTWEKERRFCGHDMVHFLDVARISWILNREEQQNIQKEIVYAAALLHDIGRHVQYEDGTPHQQSSASLAKPILADCGFSQEEQDEITEAIQMHRNPAAISEKGLTSLLYRGDKLSRSCFGCDAETECNWSYEKKNMEITW